jgi:hypothetical protein
MRKLHVIGLVTLGCLIGGAVVTLGTPAAAQVVTAGLNSRRLQILQGGLTPV